MFTTTTPTPAAWNNTGGDVRVHLVPAGTELLEADDNVWTYSLQVTTPVCGLGKFHGSWSHVQMPSPPYYPCDRCFPTTKNEA